MKKIRNFLALAIAALSAGSPSAQTVTSSRLVNPVTTISDACIERFAGYFYATGNPLNGKITMSKDMVKWDTPVLCIPTTAAKWLNNSEYTQGYTYKRVGAGDLLYRNGVWHAYFNGIGHSYCATPMGTYTEQCINAPFDDYGIDAQVFQDEDGSTYYVKKRNPSDPHPLTGAPSNLTGAEVWVFKMNSLFSRWDITEGKVQLTHQPGHPTSLNHLNFEGPELAAYHGKYYLFYASNRMGPRSGMYEVGVAENDTPLGFTNAYKYPAPVLTRNTEQQLIDYIPLAPTAEHGGWNARYMFSEPHGDWTAADYNDSSWNSGQGGFGRQEYDYFNAVTKTNARVRARHTFWTSPKLYVRRKFNIDHLPSHAGLKIWINADADLYINGHKLTYKTRSNTYSGVKLDPSWLKEGENIIACEATNVGTSENDQNLVDFGIYDTGDSEIEDMAICPAQPNFIQGPNGFENWLVYKVYINSSEKQALSRVHFRNNEVLVEPTAVKNTSGYHPKPALPTLMYYCDNAISYPFIFLDGCEWIVRDKTLRPADQKGGRLVLRKQPETHYRFEAPFRISNMNGSADLYAAYVDADNWVKIRINRNGSWDYITRVKGQENVTNHNLPENFAFLENNALVADYEEPWHTLTVYKNGSSLKVMLDAFNLTLDGMTEMPFSGAATVGIGAPDNNTEFDALCYTTGWDEYNNFIKGWDFKSGEWQQSDKGLSVVNSSSPSEFQAVKGDPMWNYDFTTTMTLPSEAAAGEAGFYPVYIDSDNNLKAVINPASSTLEITGKCNGTAITPQSVPLSRKVLRQYSFSPNSTYPTTSYTYEMSSPSVVSGVDILWCEGSYPYLKQTFGLPQEVTLYAQTDNGGWIKLETTADGPMVFSKMNTLRFAPVRTSAIRMDVKNRTGLYARAFCTYFHEEMATKYILRCRRETDGGVRIFLDDTLMATVDAPWGASTPALTAKSIPADFNTILCYQSGTVKVRKIEVEAVPCEVGQSVQLHATVSPIESTNTALCWTSSDPEIMSVDDNGVITRHKEGAVRITCHAADGTTTKGTADYTGASIEETASNEEVTIKPNPVRDGALNIISTLPVTDIELYSSSGAMTRKQSAELGYMDVSALPSGIYFAKITAGEKIYTRKVVIIS